MLARFRHPQRQGEEPYDAAWLAATGFDVRRRCRGRSASKGPATRCSAATRCSPAIASAATSAGHQQIGRLLGVPRDAAGAGRSRTTITSTPASARSRRAVAIWFPPAFDDYGRVPSREHIDELIEVEHAGSPSGSPATPSWSAGRWSPTPAARVARRARGSRLRAGRHAAGRIRQSRRQRKCLTLRLDGEEAAAWR